MIEWAAKYGCYNDKDEGRGGLMSVTAGGDEGEDCACEHHVYACIDPWEPWVAD